MRDVLVWTKAPFLVRNEFVPVDRLDGERHATSGEVKRLGDEPIVVALTTGGARIEAAVSGAHRDRLLGPCSERVADKGVPLALREPQFPDPDR